MYTFLTQYNSPNFTKASDAVATWGRPRTIEKIAIHWWNDPSTNPTFEGVISTLCNPARQASAHFVATGTGRRVACLVDPTDASWATNSANPYTISIECDPRCRDEDYDVVGELIAEIRATYGNLPLIPHKSIVATACPGNYDLNRLNAVAATKIAKATDQFGLAVTKTVTPTITRAEIEKLYLDILERPADEGGVQTYLKSGMNAGGVRNALLASPEYALLQKRKAEEQAKADANPVPVPEVPQDLDKFTPADREKLNLILSILTWLKDQFSKIFNIK